MNDETKIALDCPYCCAVIYESLNWFKKPWFACPACGKNLSSGQFATMIQILEKALDDNIEEMIKGKNPGGHGGCCGKASCD